MAGAADLAARLAELAKIPSRVAARVASDIDAQLKGEFDHGVNAYGNAWKPLLPQTIRRKRGDARILRRTDQLSAETGAKPAAGAGIEITSLDYGSFHQTGTSRMVARKILPDGGALPKPWTESIQSALDDEFGKALA
jgi:hypothetical protein